MSQVAGVNQDFNVAPLNLDPIQRFMLWKVDHPEAAKVAVIALSLLIIIGGGIAGGLLCAGGAVPFGIIILGLSIAVGSSILLLGTKREAVADELREGPSLDALADDGWANERIDEAPIENFIEAVRSLGPDRFKEKLQDEMLQKREPCSFHLLERVFKRLERIGARNVYYGPLPRYKQHFREEISALSCEQISTAWLSPNLLSSPLGHENNKILLDFLVKGQILSSEEAECIRESMRVSTIHKHMEEEAARLDDQTLMDTVRERKRIALAAIDQRFERLFRG